MSGRRAKQMRRLAYQDKDPKDRKYAREFCSDGRRYSLVADPDRRRYQAMKELYTLTGRLPYRGTGKMDTYYSVKILGESR